MEMQPPLWRRMRFTFRNATMVICSLNLVTALILLHGFFNSYSRSAVAGTQPNSAILQHIRECEEMRLAMQPLELIKRVREIQQEAYVEPEAVLQKGTKQAAAVDLSKRLKDFRSFSDATNLKALEEWRKRKMERARQRLREKNGTTARL
ncbi:uncharacterized protein LOC116209664 [Punica granatum]|uniref:Transmembrane protein n=2 Tax=Punica granatum TaxID=22663 RepID=A0A218Y1D3_PUNGR|nr:uncharacterized protein LOC116209664 [Punica granatum]OWM91115.1 hypothetical protein CDL15_Pgr010145 [Punica granatum]PKI68265.1 hypothetical protein CRG98_011345 [Punica granatum]